jgi:hypothetical protein
VPSLARFRSPLALLGALALGACAQAPARGEAAASGPNLEFVRTPSWASGLRWVTPLAAPVAASATIGAEGGRVALASTGLTLTVPAGAVSAPTRFEVAAIPGALVAYDFRPHGVAFAKPVVLEQRLRGTAPIPSGAALEGGSFADPTQLDLVAGVAQVDEYAPAAVAADGRVARVAVRHFSGWLLTTARR